MGKRINQGVGKGMSTVEQTRDLGYWCVVCMKFLEKVDGVIVHDNVDHPDLMDFSDEDNPQ